MSDALPFPTEPGHLSPAWLTTALRHAGVLGESTVSALRWAPVAEQGAAGLVGRVHVDIDGPAPAAPSSVVVKFATPQAPIRDVMHRFGFYRAEVGFYRDLGSDAGMPTPRCYHAEIDASSGHFVLVLEDMSGGRVGDPFRPRLADVEAAIDNVAAFHARWWRHPRLRQLEWLPYPEGPALDARVAALQQTFAASSGAVRARLGATFPAVLHEACNRILGDWNAFIARRMDFVPTLVHRDYHPQQMFFPSDGGGRFVVFDWQTVAIGCGADDVARILAMGLTTADRAAHQTRLVDRYHARLLTGGVEDYGRERCADDVRFGFTASLLTNVIAVATIDLTVFAERERRDGVSIAYAVFDRLACAFEANDVLTLLPQRNTKGPAGAPPGPPSSS